MTPFSHECPLSHHLSATVAGWAALVVVGERCGSPADDHTTRIGAVILLRADEVDRLAGVVERMAWQRRLV
jgi:hypothetical protein